MIKRVDRSEGDPYFLYDKRAVDDERLSYKAVGIHAYLMSKPDDWLPRETDLARRHQVGLGAVRTGIQELIACGYITRLQYRLNSRIVGWDIVVYETPEINPYYHDGQAPFTIVPLEVPQSS